MTDAPAVAPKPWPAMSIQEAHALLTAPGSYPVNSCVALRTSSYTP